MAKQIAEYAPAGRPVVFRLSKVKRQVISAYSGAVVKVNVVSLHDLDGNVLIDDVSSLALVTKESLVARCGEWLQHPINAAYVDGHGWDEMPYEQYRRNRIDRTRQWAPVFLTAGWDWINQNLLTDRAYDSVAKILSTAPRPMATYMVCNSARGALIHRAPKLASLLLTGGLPVTDTAIVGLLNHLGHAVAVHPGDDGGIELRHSPLALDDRQRVSDALGLALWQAGHPRAVQHTPGVVVEWTDRPYVMAVRIWQGLHQSHDARERDLVHVGRSLARMGWSVTTSPRRGVEYESVLMVTHPSSSPAWAAERGVPVQVWELQAELVDMGQPLYSTMSQPMYSIDPESDGWRVVQPSGNGPMVLEWAEAGHAGGTRLVGEVRGMLDDVVRVLHKGGWSVGKVKQGRKSGRLRVLVSGDAKR
jgi:hypothetical protein